MLCSADAKYSLGIVPYTTQADDSLYKISRTYNITLDDLLEANPQLKPDDLHVGEIINIPISHQRVNRPEGTDIYIIKAGESIYQLAQKHHISMNALLKENSSINPEALLPGQIIYIPKPMSRYVNKAYRISFLYPPLWAKVNSFHYAGIDGFFRVSVIKSDQSTADICKAEAYHNLNPYGANPDIIVATAADLKAYLVIPSTDQPMEMKKQTALIIKYPQVLEIGDHTYSHFILWTDLDHLNGIKDSLAFEEDMLTSECSK
jgi:LysM repeat protein